MRSRRLLPLAAVAIPAAAALAAAGCAFMRPVAEIGTLQEQEFAIEREGAVDASLRVSFWGGSLRVRPSDATSATRLRTRDNLDALEPHADSRRDGDHLDLGFWLDSDANVVNFKSWSGERSRSVRDSEHDVVNEWDLDLSRALPLSLELDLSTCDADVELGGLALRSASLDLGGGTAVVSFDRPHPDRLERLTLAVGAGRLATRTLGNSHARSISVHAGAGSCVLDLAGDWRADAFVAVDAGACRVEVRVPRDLAVRANLRQTLFSGLSAPEFSYLGDHGFASPAWGKAGLAIVVDVSASLGEVHLVLE